VKLVYFSYPYTDDPQKRVEEIRKLVLIILKKHSDWVPLVPHFVLDALYDYPTGYKKEAILEWEFAVKELALIYYCDVFVYSEGLITESRGMVWEWSFARWLQEMGHPIKIMSYEELLWRDEDRRPRG